MIKDWNLFLTPLVGIPLTHTPPDVVAFEIAEFWDKDI